MARTKQAARKTTGGKAPRKILMPYNKLLMPYNKPATTSGPGKKEVKQQKQDFTDTSYFVGRAGEPEIVFVSSGKEKLTYRVHNAKLAAMPEGTVLHGLAKTNFVGDNNTIILPEDVKPEGFHNLLQLLYGKKTCITPENWEATLRVAFMYTMAELEVQVANFLETSLTASMALRCLSMCQSLSVYSSSVLDACWKYVDRNGEVILRSKEFLDINHATMMRIIERDTLVVKENTVYRTAVKWAKATSNVASV